MALNWLLINPCRARFAGGVDCNEVINDNSNGKPGRTLSSGRDINKITSPPAEERREKGEGRREMDYKRKLAEIWEGICTEQAMRKRLCGTDVGQLPALYRRYRLKWQLQRPDVRRQLIRVLTAETASVIVIIAVLYYIAGRG